MCTAQQLDLKKKFKNQPILIYPPMLVKGTQEIKFGENLFKAHTLKIKDPTQCNLPQIITTK